MQTIGSLDELETHYGTIGSTSITKVAHQMTPRYREWVKASRFVVLATVGTEGTDASPRGDVEPVVRIHDAKTILLPDWRGNNRLDSLRNIVTDGRVSLMFMVPGCLNVVRVNGRAALTADACVKDSFERDGKQPATVIVITIEEVYFQCAKAIMRSEIWSGKDLSNLVPTAGDFIKEFKSGFDGRAYDEGYAEYAAGRMW